MDIIINKIPIDDLVFLKKMAYFFKHSKEYNEFENTFSFSNNYLELWMQRQGSKVYHIWAAFYGNKIIGGCVLSYQKIEKSNKHAKFDILINLKFKKLNIHSLLLNTLLQFSKTNNIGLLKTTNIFSRTNSMFYKKYGGFMYDVKCAKTLNLKEINKTFLDDWITKGSTTNRVDIKVEFWYNATPTKFLKDYAIAKSFLNDTKTPVKTKWIKSEEILRKKTLKKWWVCLIYYKKSIVGYSEVFFYKNSITAKQEGLAIKKKYRGLGFAKILKYNTLKEVLKQRNIYYIYTRNSIKNDAINNINSYLGFKEIYKIGKWQFKVSQ